MTYNGMNDITKTSKMEKKRVMVSYEKLTSELHAAISKQYPKGYANGLTRVEAPQPFYYLTLEMPDTQYMVKLNLVQATNAFQNR